jgi:two-component system, cell cycle sensor histidine kinase and response regulator CckA
LMKDTFPRSIQIETRFAYDLPPVHGNPTQLHQMLMNLCVNARDAMPGGGVLWLKLETIRIEDGSAVSEGGHGAGPYVVLSVSDTGHGMTPDVLGRIFDPFFTTKPEGKGTGLGLSTVKSIVKNHNGFTKVHSQPGQGATFQVFLPAVQLTETTDAASRPAHAPTGAGQLILVVDDELAISEILRGTLESYNYRTLAAQNGAEAVAMFQQNREQIQAVLIDIAMPVMDGYAAMQALKKTKPGVKIICLSGMSIELYQEQGIEFHGHAFLKKPCTANDLLVAVHQVLTADSKGA